MLLAKVSLTTLSKEHMDQMAMLSVQKLLADTSVPVSLQAANLFYTNVNVLRGRSAISPIR